MDMGGRQCVEYLRDIMRVRDTMAEQQEAVWLAEQLKRYTYRPGWSMRILLPIPPTHPLFNSPRLEVRYEALDSRNPGRTIPLVNTTMIPHMYGDADEFAKWLAHALLEIEWHESREWLRQDGAIFDDPHERR